MPAQQNEGVRLALYFERKAAGLTSAYGILADAALLKVVQTALGIPAATSAMDIDRQAEMIAARLDIEDLKDPEKLEKLPRPLRQPVGAARTRRSAPASPSVLFSQPLELGIGADLLASLQNLQARGQLSRCSPTSTSACPRRSRCSAGWRPSPTTSPTPRPRASAPRRSSSSTCCRASPPIPSPIASAGKTYLSRKSGEIVRTDNLFDVAVQGEAWLGDPDAGRHGLHPRRAHADDRDGRAA